MNALPLTRHDWHGDWNYTVRPEAHCRDGIAPLLPHDQPGPGRAWLAHPAITGMPPAAWDTLITGLGTAQQAQREADLDHRRGGPRQKVPATGRYTGRRPGLTFVDRLLATLLHQRLSLPQVVIAPLFAVTPETINRAIGKTRRLLDSTGYTIEPANIRLKTLTELAEFAISAGITTGLEIKPAC